MGRERTDFIVQWDIINHRVGQDTSIGYQLETVRQTKRQLVRERDGQSDRETVSNEQM